MVPVGDRGERWWAGDVIGAASSAGAPLSLIREPPPRTARSAAPDRS